MKIGFIGLGKLGLPVALAINAKGHEVMGYDLNPAVKGYLSERAIPFKEEGIEPLLETHTVQMTDDIRNVVDWADIVFIAVQTPHEPRFEGATRLPEDRADFDYAYLTEAVAEVSKWCLYYKKHTTVVVISTCLPGTYNRRIKNLLNEYVHYVYNPFFIAMGTVVHDFLNPEFVLLGGEWDRKRLIWSQKPWDKIDDFYRTIHDKKLFPTDITTAEGIKVFYNTFITMKTVLANTYGEMAHKLGMNVDDIYAALSLATDRIISPKYLKAGMGDGGGCHPRDNIALSDTAKRVGLSHNIFEDLMKAREDHAEWLASLIIEASVKHKIYDIAILGRAFKPETNIETGSPAVLVANILREKGIEFTHEEDVEFPNKPYVIFLGTQHARYFAGYNYPAQSVVIDPFGELPESEDITVVRIGRP